VLFLLYLIEVIREKQFNRTLQCSRQFQGVNQRRKLSAGFPAIQVSRTFKAEQFDDVPLPEIPFFTVSPNLIRFDFFQIAGHWDSLFVFVY